MRTVLNLKDVNNVIQAAIIALKSKCPEVALSLLEILPQDLDELRDKELPIDEEKNKEMEELYLAHSQSTSSTNPYSAPYSMPSKNTGFGEIPY